MNTVYEVSVFDVYGNRAPKIPDGYEEVIFRLVKEGDIYLGPGASVPYIQKCKPFHGFPRIILRKKTERKFEKIVSSCLECPHCVTGINLIGCGATRPITFFHNVASIPDWCPLPKN